MVWEVIMYPKSITFHFIEYPTAVSLRRNSYSRAVSRKEQLVKWFLYFY